MGCSNSIRPDADSKAATPASPRAQQLPDELRQLEKRLLDWAFRRPEKGSDDNIATLRSESSLWSRPLPLLPSRAGALPCAEIAPRRDPSHSQGRLPSQPRGDPQLVRVLPPPPPQVRRRPAQSLQLIGNDPLWPGFRALATPFPGVVIPQSPFHPPEQFLPEGFTPNTRPGWYWHPLLPAGLPCLPQLHPPRSFLAFGCGVGANPVLPYPGFLTEKFRLQQNRPFKSASRRGPRPRR